MRATSLVIVEVVRVSLYIYFKVNQQNCLIEWLCGGRGSERRREGIDGYKFWGKVTWTDLQLTTEKTWEKHICGRAYLESHCR